MSWKEKLHYHKLRFGEIDSPILDLFEQVFLSSENTIDALECSIKYEQGVVYPSRFSVMFDSCRGASNVLNFIFNHFFYHLPYKTHLDYGLLKDIIHDTKGLSQLYDIMLGVDIRKDILDSRIKIWFSINESNFTFFNKAVAQYAAHRDIDILTRGNKLLFGIDLSFSGTSEIKLYFRYDAAELKNNILRKNLGTILSSQILELGDISSSTFIILKSSKSTSKEVAFFPLDIKEFCLKIGNSALDDIVANQKYFSHPCNISFLENEISERNVTNFNFYY